MNQSIPEFEPCHAPFTVQVASRHISLAIAAAHESGPAFDSILNELLAVKINLARQLHCVQARGLYS